MSCIDHEFLMANYPKPEDAAIYIVLCTLPVKTVLQCMSICKNWHYSIIQTPSFIIDHVNRQNTGAPPMSDPVQSPVRRSETEKELLSIPTAQISSRKKRKITWSARNKFIIFLFFFTLLVWKFDFYETLLLLVEEIKLLKLMLVCIYTIIWFLFLFLFCFHCWK